MANQNKEIPRLVSIEYPAVVNDVDKALLTLGGINKISEVYSDANRRMELRFRPTDAYCKPACGERLNSTSILIKVIQRRKKTEKGEASIQSTTFEVKPIGLIHTTFKFENLCDFQYLPVMESADGKSLNCISNTLLPRGITSSSWLDGPSSLFLTPAIFSRIDSPQDYNRIRLDPSESTTKVHQDGIGQTRQKRTHFSIYHSFKDEGVPSRPLPGAIDLIRYRLMDSALYTKLREEFEIRPIWSKNALRARLRYSKDNLKCLLPSIAYYFPTGPWRNLWVRLGFDPREDPNAWLYQTFDFRIRQAGGCKTKVEAKRTSNHMLPYKSVQHTKPRAAVIKTFNMKDDTGREERDLTSQKNNGHSEEFYLFRNGTIPPYRQMFYQYCDIDVPQIRTLLESAIIEGANKVCSEKNGWLPAGVEIKCRDILSSLVEKTLSQRNLEGQALEDVELMSNSEMEEDSAQEGNSTEDEN